jgi:hypothetical protein
MRRRPLRRPFVVFVFLQGFRATKMTGHKTEAVYRRYAIVSESDLREAAAKLAAVRGNGDSSAGLR